MFGESKLERGGSLLVAGSTSAIGGVDTDDFVFRLLENAFRILGSRLPSNGLGDDGYDKTGRTSKSKGVIGIDEWHSHFALWHCMGRPSTPVGGDVDTSVSESTDD